MLVMTVITVAVILCQLSVLLQCSAATCKSRAGNQIYFSVKVGPDDATFLFGTRDIVSMEHCSTLSQGVASASNNVG